MFDSVGPAELLTLALVGMFILGPERLPQAIAWVSKTVRQVKEYAAGARDQLQGEFGTDFDDLRKPLDDLRSIRDLDPRRAARQHLVDATSTGTAAAGAIADAAGAGTTVGAGTTIGAAGTAVGAAAPAPAPVGAPLAAGEAAPFDDDAT